MEKRNTVKPRFSDTRLIRTPHYKEQFALSQGKENRYISLNSTRLMCPSLIRTLSRTPSVCVLTGFDCTINLLVLYFVTFRVFFFFSKRANPYELFKLFNTLSYVQTNALSPKIVEPTMLGVVASVLSVVCKRMQQLPTMLVHHACWSITRSHRIAVSKETICSAHACPQQCTKSFANGSIIVAIRFGDHETKEMRKLFGSKV